MTRYKILSTKTLGSALRAAAHQSLELVEKDFICTEPIIDEQKEKALLRWAQTSNLHVAFTSTQSVLVLASVLPEDKDFNWTIFCLSGKTRETLMQPRFQRWGSIAGTAPNAAALAGIIISNNVSELVFFCSDRRRDELPLLLQTAGLCVHEEIIYHTVEISVPYNEPLDGILFFSPSAVHSFFSMNSLEERTVCFAIGPTTAESLANATDNCIMVSPEPTPEALLAAVQFYFDQINHNDDPEE